MPGRYHHILSRFLDSPQLVHPGKGTALACWLVPQLIGASVDVIGPNAVHHVAFSGGRLSMGRVGDPMGRRYEEAGVADRMLFKVDGVAVVPIEGTLIHKGKWLGSYSGDTSYEGIQAAVGRARRDPAVKAVVL